MNRKGQAALAVLAGAVVAGWLGGCAADDEAAATIRLVERFAEAERSREPAGLTVPEPIEWRFDGGTTAGSWSPGPMVAATQVAAGRLAGRAAGPLPGILLSAERPLGENDRLHAVEVRIRVSAGSELLLATSAEETIEPASMPRWLSGLGSANVMTTPLLPGDETRTYRLSVGSSFLTGGMPLAGIRHVILRPTDAAGAGFELESLRLIFRSEQLAGVATGVGWHGLSEVWRESLVTRAPAVLSYRLDLPPRPWLDLVVGTIEDGPVTFEVRAAAGGRELTASRTVTTRDRWEPLAVDLAPLAGKTVTLSLTAGGDDNRIAFWGSPVVRGRRPVDAAGNRPAGVILIVADTLRKDHLEPYGYGRANAPTLTRLAAEGALFRDAVSQASWTKASMPSILTSRYLTSHGVNDMTARLPSAAVTAAELFRDAGYATFATSSVAFSGQLSNLHQGVEVLHERVSVDQAPGVSSSKTARIFVDRLIPWLEGHRRVPFFALLHVFDPHSPFEPYPPYDTLWTDAAAKRRYLQELARIRPHIAIPLMQVFGMPERAAMERAGVEIEPYLEHERAWYDGSIKAMDLEIARLLETLDRLGLAEDTLIVFTADHGEEFLEHDRHFHGFSVYGEMTGVPLIAHWPGGVSGGRVISETVETIDILPTLAELAGLSVPETAQGDSLAPLLLETASEWRPRPAFIERYTQPSVLDEAPDTVDSRAVVSGRWKLIHNVRRPEGWPEFELYDHLEDPLDQRNLAEAHSEVVERLAELLENWHRHVAGDQLPSDEEAARDLPAEELEQLRALGYLG
ncbi:MAG: sulfatase [Thermoanaerobaculia bacterium]